MKPRKIAVVTGTRAEYGLLYWLLREIATDAELELQLIVTAAHLSPEQGLTVETIEKDGFSISAKIEMLVASDTPVGIAKSIGLGTIGFADALDRLRPDLLVVLGDRFEILAAAQAALPARVPIAHIHGGELTEGAIDDAVRHAVTKMAQLHFTAADPYRDRVLQLGEDPAKTFNFGAIGIDNIERLTLLDRPALEQSIGMQLGARCFLVTYHPETLDPVAPEVRVCALFRALDRFPDAHLVFTKPNADAGGRVIATLIDDYVRTRAAPATVHTTLGQLRYLSALKHVDVVIGNSSSALIEMPVFRKPSVNIGDRQKGRLLAASVVSCASDEESITAAIDRALSPSFSSEFRAKALPYGSGDVSRRVKEVLKTVSLDGLVRKTFVDRPLFAGHE